MSSSSTPRLSLRGNSVKAFEPPDEAVKKTEPPREPHRRGLDVLSFGPTRSIDDSVLGSLDELLPAAAPGTGTIKGPIKGPGAR